MLVWENIVKLMNSVGDKIKMSYVANGLKDASVLLGMRDHKFRKATVQICA